MRKIGNFLLGFVPVCFALGAQFLALGLMSSVAALIFVGNALLSGGSVDLDRFFVLLTDADFSTCMMLIYSILCIVFCGLWYYRSCGGDYRPDIRKTFCPPQLLGIVLLVPGMQFASGCIIGLISLVRPRWLEQYNDLMETAGLDQNIGLLLLCYSVVLAPIGEELIFRGVTMRVFRRTVPFWAANLLQALLFGAFHMNWVQGIYAFTLGLILGYVCEIGGSIYYSLLLHVLFNFWGTILSPLSAMLPDTALVSLLYALFCIVCLFLGFVLLQKGVRQKRNANRAASAPAEALGSDTHTTP